jgi:hypothetical protein
MASTYSSNLKIELMGTGENAGTWGTITNTNLGTAYEQAVIGLGNPDYTSDANLTITLTNSNAAQAARALVLNVTSVFGSLTQTRELIVPTIQKQYIVQNNTTGGQSITVKTSGGTGITVPNGRKAHLYVDGTNVIQMFDFVDINGGTIDGATVGAASASTGAFTSLTASGATTLNGAVALGDASGDLITVPGTVNSNLLFTDATYDIGASGATRPRDLFLSRNLTVGGTLTLAGGVNLNGNVTVGDASTDTLTINSTITSNLIFTDNTYDIGASGATRPRSLFLAGNITAAGNQTLTGALTVDSTTDSTSTTTGSIQTDGGLGVAKALFVGTTANIAGAVTLSGGTANGVTYLNGSKVLTSGSALTYNGTVLYTNGKIGVGETNPTALVEARNTSIARMDADSSAVYFGSGNNYPVVFKQNDTEGMRLNSTGLGIGTSSPQSKLHIEAGSSQTTYGSGTVSNQGITVVNNNGGNNFPYGIQFGGYPGYTFGGIYGIQTSGNNNTIGDIAIALRNANTDSTFTERLRITSTGNVGIGTSSPTSKLTVSGDIEIVGGVATIKNSSGFLQIGTTSNDRLELITNGTLKATLSAAGDLGIGTSSPTAKLDVSGGASAPVIALTTTGPSPGAAIKFLGVTSSYKNWQIGATFTTTAGALEFTPSTTDGGSTFTTPAMTLNSSGNLGVGTTSPTNFAGYTTLEVKGPSEGGRIIANYNNSVYMTIFTNSNSVGYVGTTSAHPTVFLTSGSERMRITDAGNVGIGTSSPANPTGGIGVEVSNSNGASLRLTNSTTYLDLQSGTNANYIVSNGANPLIFYTNSSERARIDSSGNLLVGATTVGMANGGIQSQPNGNTTNVPFFGCAGNSSSSAYICYGLYSTSLSQYQFYVDYAGTVFARSIVISSLSDQRLKENIVDLDVGLDKIMALKPRKFDWKEGKGNNKKNVRGFIAQELEQVFPDLIDEWRDPAPEGEDPYKSVRQDLMPVLVKAIQEQQAIIESLKARLDAANL